ncbi:hypothetical protein MTR67_052511 [Solanum verrucosum]|uniref:Tf2-1-like SH3-like domain-containing protein n=1 Tax=Solanum verrucosum TaxID=315347 RepID=A0AAF0V9E8_SOLVR|nr:hypothetical protein MTR67_052511 [Solanum verrucosum]
MLRACVIDFGGHWDKFLPLCEFAYNNIYHSSIDMAPFKAVYGRGCKSPIGWFEAGDVKPLGADLVKDAKDKVMSLQAKLLVAQSRQKKYADHKVRDMIFQTSENVLLKVSPMKGVMRFGKKAKLSPSYIGLFEILDYVGLVAYRLDLPPNLLRVHLIFHVSMLKRYHGDSDYIIKWDSIVLDKDLQYEEEPVVILDRDMPIGALAFTTLMLSAGWFHYHKAAPNLAWFQDVESMLNHHLAGLLGLGSLSWAGHQAHVSLPINQFLNAGVDPKEKPLPHEFILNGDLLAQLYPSFAEGETPFFTLNWSKYADFLTFGGGLDPVTGALWLTDIANHHLPNRVLVMD